ncbi:NAD-dependent epimerase/dehydratase family protein [Niveibacterium sp. SC-1]|uniref:NAD-dependent epimerase/dehydratase family protein n=1 Tax=Niveibacterium sp. SC-1 TaxID=3135646 RepID=UPI00311FF146
MAKRPLALVTGANGFVGRHLVDLLQRSGWRVRAALRAPYDGAWDESVVVGELCADTPWEAALDGADYVFHLAARVHVLHETDADPEAAFTRSNVDGTRALAIAAAASDVKRLVFVSTAKVCGETTPRGAPFDDACEPAPQGPYARSKWAAETAIAGSGVAYCILRPPLVYGPGVGANFAAMMRWVERGWWLPLGAICNERSLLYVGNLCDALLRAATHPDAQGEHFLVDDGTPLSTPELLRAVAAAARVKSRLIAVPQWMLAGALRLAGRGAEASRLTGSLAIDSSRIRKKLDWQPPFSRQDGLRATLAQNR